MRVAAASLRRTATHQWIPAVAWAAAVLALLVTLPAGGADLPKLMSTVSPLDGDSVSGSIRWEVAVKNETPSRIDFAIDGVVKWTENKAPYVFNGDSGTLDTKTLYDGAHTLEARLEPRGNGRKGNEPTERLSIQVQVDNRRPELRVSTATPANAQTVSAKVKWEAVVDAGTADRVDFAIDGVVKWTEQEAPYVFNGDSGLLDTTKLSDGSHELTVTALDAQGISSNSSVDVVVANAVTPPPGFTTNVSQAMTVTTPFSWTFTAGDPSVKGYFWADGQLLATVDGPGPYSWTLPIGLLSDGTHTLGDSWETSDGQRKSPASSYSVTVRNGSSSSGFTTNVSQAMTVTTPFSWTFTAGDPSVKGYFWADGQLLATVDGPGPYSWTLPVGLLSDGTHSLRHSWLVDLESQTERFSSTYTVTVRNTSGGSGSTALGGSLPQLPPAPPGTSTRTIQVDTVSELKSAFSDLRGGDRVVVEPGTYPTQHTIKGKRLTVPAQIVFKPGASLTGGTRSSGNYVGFYVSDSDNIWVTGGNFSDPEGDAIKIESSTNIVFNGAVAHHSGDSCIMVAANTRDNRAIWLLNVETYACGSSQGDLGTSGTYPVGYWRKGTHGIYYGSSRNGYETYGGAIVNLYGHDQPNGSILQIGNGARGLVVTGATLVRAMGDPTVYAGSALNFWGDYNANVLWVNVLVYRANNHVLQATSSTQGAGSAIRSLMYSGIGSSTQFLQSSSGAPTIGQTWSADPQLGGGDVPLASSPAVGKADAAYLWPTDRTGKARAGRTLGAFEPSG